MLAAYAKGFFGAGGGVNPVAQIVRGKFPGLVFVGELQVALLGIPQGFTQYLVRLFEGHTRQVNFLHMHTRVYPIGIHHLKPQQGQADHQSKNYQGHRKGH